MSLHDLDAALGGTLLAIARRAISEALGVPHAAPSPNEHPLLRQPGASFVTLTQEGALRGCIGSLRAGRALHVDVAENALAAAFRDPRFGELELAELEITAVEVSVLSAPEPLPVADEAEACRVLRPGVHGVILSAGGRQATFLPQVWEDLPDPLDFLAHLKHKAGLPARGWLPGTRLQVYEVAKFAEARRSARRPS